VPESSWGSGVDALIRRKADRCISVCIPARDEQETIEAVVALAMGLHRAGLFDEVLVVDDHSRDTTVDRAIGAGAGVVSNTLERGKGGALATAVACTRGDILLFLDADVTSYTESALSALVTPLLLDRKVQLVKGAYRRPLAGRAGEGGRVTELVARPLLERFFPELAQLSQPLAGETALRRRALEGIGLAPGYGVEIALLIDVYERHGIDAVAEVDLVERTHRNRPLGELHHQSRQVIDAVLARTPRSASPG
jgi:glucosyl-3-phosphoglycerate synthase